MTVSSIVVVGATGLLGEAVIGLLGRRDDLGVEVVALASARSVGKRVQFGERLLKVRDQAGFEFADGQLVMLCVPAKIAAKLLPRLREAGATVLDFSGSMQAGKPALPWIAGGRIEAGAKELRAASAVSVHVASAVEAIGELAGIVDLRVAVIQAVSGRGQRGVAELAGQAARLLNAQPFEHKVFPAQIAFNALPDFDVDRDVADLASLLSLDEAAVSVARSWASIFHGQAVQVEVVTREPVDADALIAIWRENPRLEVESGTTLSPVADGSQADVVNIGGLRVRAYPGGGSRVSYWSVTDEVRFASAANGIAIGESLIKPRQ
ncbi:MAG: hypothetical protein H6980_02950 [Gammaproteobacteria bacterium]|nr:hypothetical protein [Gammaproteobacteria bacterium]